MIAKVYTPPPINKTAPAERANHWNQVVHFARPFPNPTPRDFGFWFNYFWGEVCHRDELSLVEQAKAADLFLEVFNVDGGHATPVPTLATWSDARKENVLRQLLLLGFRRVALEPPPTTHRALFHGKPLAPLPLVAQDAAELNLAYVIHSTATGPEAGIALPIAFRCDSRPYEVLCQSGGMKARARSLGEKVFFDYAMDQPWNPFSNPVYRNSLWLRMGSLNKDNCLQTVLSVGPRLSDIAHFPILSDTSLVFPVKSADGQFLALKPADEWTAQDSAAALAHPLHVRAIPDPAGGVSRLEKDTQAYAFHLRGLHGVNTSAQFSGSDAFAERGLESIPLDHLLAVVEFTQRWWFNPVNRQIMLYKLQFQPIRWLPTRQAVDARIGSSARTYLEAIINKEMIIAEEKLAAEESAYEQFQTIKPDLPTPDERRQIINAIREFRATAPPKDHVPSKERLAAQTKLPALRAKIDRILPIDWKEYYQRRAQAH